MSSPSAEGQRLFFALWPEEGVRRALYRAGQAVAPRGGKPMALENIHITLVFLGTIDTDKRVCLKRCADSIQLPPFELVLDCAGYWPRPRVVWLGCSTTPPLLLALVGDLNRGLVACGLPPEPRPYSPHLTVLRKASRGPEQTAIAPLSWPVHDFVLVQSLTRPQGVQYQVVRRWPLVGQL